MTPQGKLRARNAHGFTIPKLPMNQTDARSLRARGGTSLVFRFSATASVVVVVAMAVLGWFNFQGSKKHITETWRRTLDHERQVVALKCQAMAGDVARDALVLARSQPVIDFLANKSLEARVRVESDFRALMAVKPTYMQVRIITAGGDWKEMVRLDRSGAIVTTMPQERLQPKGDRDYVREGAKMGAGEVYLSDIDLNRDFGGITKPYTPTIRAVVNVLWEPAMVVINVDLNALFTDLQKQRAERTRLYLASGTGSWLVHPRPEALFGTDLGHAWSATKLSPADTAEFAADWVFSEATHPLLLDGKRSVFIRTASSGEVELDGLRTARNRALLISGSAALAGILVLVLLARWTTARLRKVAEAIGDFDAGRTPELLPETSNDEVGLLAAGFNSMTKKIAAQVAAIESAHAETLEASRAKEEFFAVMSHEIRTPLNAVTGLLRLLERNNPGPHQVPVLRSINAAAQQLTALFNGVLDWSKLRAGKMEVRSEPFGLRRLLQDIALVHRPLAAQKGLEFIEDIAPEVPDFAIGDATRLSQILHNLLNNAVKFTSEGGVTLRVDWSAGRLRGEVSDTGIGIPDADRERIFSPFDQTAKSQRFGGTGLGLSITRSLLEMQGGKISVEPCAQRGSRFVFELPCEATETPAGQKEQAVARLEGRRILYVEDTASNREVMSALIEETGATLEMAETAGAGLELLRQHTYDIALFDLQLPDMTGLELARAALLIRPELPIFAVTAQLSDEARKECIRAGMRGAVAKPIVPAILFATLESCAVPASAQRCTPLHEMFTGDQLKRVLISIADEMRKAKVEVARAVETKDAEALRKTRHRLHSAISQMELDAVNSAMERLIAGDWTALENTLAELERAAMRCEREASAQNRQPGE